MISMSEEISCINCPRFNKKHYSPCNIRSKITIFQEINAIFSKERDIWIELYKTFAQNCTSRLVAIEEQKTNLTEFL